MALIYKSLYVWLLLFYVCAPNDAEYANKTYLRKELLQYLDLGESAEVIRRTQIPTVPHIMKQMYRKMTKSHRAVERGRERDQQELVRLFFPTGMLCYKYMNGLKFIITIKVHAVYLINVSKGFLHCKCKVS